MGLALILTFSPWEKEEYGACLEFRRVGWDGQSDSVRLSQTNQTKGGLGKIRIRIKNMKEGRRERKTALSD
jgi:hypothetical protein